jgi:AbrB family looped-hinge helix DNA binding protein
LLFFLALADRVLEAWGAFHKADLTHRKVRVCLHKEDFREHLRVAKPRTAVRLLSKLFTGRFISKRKLHVIKVLKVCNNTYMTTSTLKIYGTAALNIKGQVVIPSKARTRLGWKPGTHLVIMSNQRDNGVVIVKSEEIESRIKKL